MFGSDHLEVEMVSCASYGKQTFNGKFYIFRGATIAEKLILEVEATPNSEGECFQSGSCVFTRRG